MSQHDMNIANQGFPAFRSDLNNALTALASTSNGTSAPSTTFAYQMWVDTTTATGNILYIRNSANDGNIEIARINQSTGKFIFSETAQFEDGSAGSPSISFISDSDTGFYRQGANRMDGVAGGTIGLTVSDTGVVVNENSENGMDFRIELPTELVFGTTADGANSITERLTISQSGHIATVSGNASTSSTPKTNSSATGSVAVDFATGDNHHLTLTGNVTSLTASNEVAGQSGVIVFTQDGTGGRTVSLSASDYETAGGGGSPAITLSSAASAVDVVPYYVRASGSVLLGTPLLAVG
jgi:hypothetical protein